jgi:membrane protease YdiL (CAAX protease family)
LVGQKPHAGFLINREVLLPAIAAVLLPLAILSISMGITYLTTGVASLKGLGTSGELPDVSFLAFMILNVVIIGIGEEAGWRGFVLPYLQRRFTALTASLLLSIAWAAWHWPLFFYPRSGFYIMTWPGIAGWLFSLALGSVLLTWLFNWSRGSILVCALFHGTMDIVFTAPYANEHITTYNGVLITLAGILAIIVFKPTHLSPTRRTVF